MRGGFGFGAGVILTVWADGLGGGLSATAGDSRLVGAVELVRSKQDGRGRWSNEYAYADKTWVPFEVSRSPSKWVTLRACRMLKAVVQAQGELPR